MRSGNIASPAHSRDFATDHFQGHIDYILVSEAGTRPSPQVYLVRQPASCTLRPHFHLEDQFQLVLGGSGRIGVHALERGSIHFASRHSGYGPLVPGSDGLDYLTVRAVTDTGLWALPESRAQNNRSIRKHQVTLPAPAEFLSADTPPTQMKLFDLARAEEGGVAAWCILVPPHQEFVMPHQAGASGQFVHVFAGGFGDGSGRYAAGACIWLDADERFDACTSSAAGAVLTTFSFPATSLLPLEEILGKPSDSTAVDRRSP